MIKRYDISDSCGQKMIEEECGDWVSHDDHIKEVERLKAEHDEDMTNLIEERDFYKKAAAEDARLFDQAKAEVERLKNELSFKNHYVSELQSEIKRLKGGWISVDDSLPSCKFEDAESGNFISQSVELSDGWKLARGHYVKEIGWIVYDAPHDFQLVETDEITHWKPLLEPPGDV
jgi:uncharacterized small protein (DUF1192 family)